MDNPEIKSPGLSEVDRFAEDREVQFAEMIGGRIELADVDSFEFPTEVTTSETGQ